MDVVFCSFLRKGLCESDHRQLGGRIVGLPKATKEPCCRRRVDHSAILLFPEMWPSSPGTLIRALDVDINNQIPVLVGHVLEANIPEDARVVDEDIDPAVVLDGCLDDLVTVGDTVVVGYRLAASGPYLVDNNICGLLGVHG